MFLFKDPIMFWLLLLLPVILIVDRPKRSGSTFIFSSEELVKDLKPTARVRLGKSLVILKVAAIALMIMALARPQAVLDGSKAVSEGVDIVLVVDTSTSMLAEDFMLGRKRINRFDLVREVVKDFVKKRKDDRIGMVAFAARAYTVCPLTTDYAWLNENLDRVRVGMIEDATAVGSAIASSINRLKNSKTKSKIIILLTDGVSNAGNVSPIVAAEAAKAMKIKIYAIAVGTKGLSPYPMKDYYGRTVYRNIPIEIDEESMRKIADTTGGKYYLATDTEKLRNIYDEINSLEKSNIEHFGYREYSELFYYFLIPGMMLLIVSIFLSNTVFLKVP
jgi:Ca-activated chloride channel family protein